MGEVQGFGGQTVLGVDHILRGEGGKVEPVLGGGVEGDEETPSPSASTTMRKYLAGSTSLSAPTEAAMSLLLPENQVGKRMALERCALSVPQVR